eukprot:gnl/TRDRNA2_/TRDRNA2_189929_c0_seq1.p1 gnl/TRDRNA2_/TRDRNA2_189929_c0~~gnl/TRDRNA2_/TRDRNA2_189929_c0_seq1.p1  ORF type:complete len:450 (-),score=74.43 gnl/TRDRNA2_/TRDRNA2_189929_c0_seq1:93-1442(-)
MFDMASDAPREVLSAVYHPRSLRLASSVESHSTSPLLWALLLPPISITLAVIVGMLGSLLVRLSRRRKSQPKGRAPSSAAPGVRGFKRQHGQPVAQAAPVRDIELKVVTEDAGEAVMTIDGLATGDALLIRARGCLGEGLSDLKTCNGEALNLVKPLVAQGLTSGDVLTATIVGKRAPVPVAKRRGVEIQRFSYEDHADKDDFSRDRFEVTVSASQEAEAIAAAEPRTVTAHFEEDSFTLQIRGAKVDYIFKRQTMTSALPVRFALCPSRCTCTVTPRRKVVLNLRPYPQDWLPAGTRVRIDGLTSQPELNGCSGAVKEFFEWQNENTPERYSVTIDGDPDPNVKRFKRANLFELHPDGAGGEITFEEEERLKASEAEKVAEAAFCRRMFSDKKRTATETSSTRCGTAVSVTEPEPEECMQNDISDHHIREVSDEEADRILSAKRSAGS